MAGEDEICTPFWTGFKRSEEVDYCAIPPKGVTAFMVAPSHPGWDFNGYDGELPFPSFLDYFGPGFRDGSARLFENVGDEVEGVKWAINSSLNPTSSNGPPVWVNEQPDIPIGLAVMGAYRYRLMGGDYTFANKHPSDDPYGNPYPPPIGPGVDFMSTHGGDYMTTRHIKTLYSPGLPCWMSVVSGYHGAHGVTLLAKDPEAVLDVLKTHSTDDLVVAEGVVADGLSGGLTSTYGPNITWQDTYTRVRDVRVIVEMTVAPLAMQIPAEMNKLSGLRPGATFAVEARMGDVLDDGLPDFSAPLLFRVRPPEQQYVFEGARGVDPSTLPNMVQVAVMAELKTVSILMPIAPSDEYTGPSEPWHPPDRSKPGFGISAVKFAQQDGVAVPSGSDWAVVYTTHMLSEPV